ncbi:MAG TPA: FlgD immunoglobulin-like domain containing protein, partial [Gaiellales bacterium]|nr:FlgD immunoglobulin-like domain containing protein [Gaiellales bacterium]
ISGGPTTVTMRLSPTQIAGLTANGHVKMFAPNPFQSGSSVSHWDVSCTPNLLMEPAINPDLTDSIDLADAMFRDLGWLPRLLDVPGGGPAARVSLANRPNPAVGATDIQFSLNTDERIELSIYDLSGRAVRSLAKGTFSAGPNTVHWDGLDSDGRPVAPGIYMARLKGQHTNATHNVVWMN